MRTGFVGSMACLVASTGLAFAEAEKVLPTESQPQPAAAAAWEQPCVCVMEDTRPCPRWWIGTEYLMWWLKDQDVPPGLITTGPAGPGAGAPNVPGTTRLDPLSYDYGTASGLRVNAGRWLGDEQRFGVEASGFLLERVASGFAVNDPTGTLVIAQPFFTTAGVGGAIPASLPGVFGGGVGIVTDNRFWGSEINMIHARQTRRAGLSNTLLLGFRYLDLNETLRIASPAINLVPTGLGPTGTFSVFNDYWGAHNQFYGGQVGTRFEYQTGRLFINGLAKVGLGSTHQSVTTNGNFAVVPPGGPATVTGGGAYNNAANIGRITQDEFTVVPELQANVGYQLSNGIRTYVGYNFLYWSDVARPGDQIDIVTGPGRPTVPMNRTDFWAHGLNFGLELRY